MDRLSLTASKGCFAKSSTCSPNKRARNWPQRSSRKPTGSTASPHNPPQDERARGRHAKRPKRALSGLYDQGVSLLVLIAGPATIMGREDGVLHRGNLPNFSRYIPSLRETPARAGHPKRSRNRSGSCGYTCHPSPPSLDLAQSDRRGFLSDRWTPRQVTTGIPA